MEQEKIKDRSTPKYLLFDEQGAVKASNVADGAPYTADDLIEQGYEEIPDDEWILYLQGYKRIDGKPVYVPPEISQEEKIKQYMAQIQGMMDTQAKADGYDDTFNAISYKGSEIPRFANDAERYQKWRDNVWYTANGIMIKYKAGLIKEPTIEEVMAQLPKLEERPDEFKYDFEKEG